MFTEEEIQKILAPVFERHKAAVEKIILETLAKYWKEQQDLILHGLSVSEPERKERRVRLLAKYHEGLKPYDPEELKNSGPLFLPPEPENDGSSSSQ